MKGFLNPSFRWYYPLRWLLIILLGLAIYGQTFGFNFVFDDLDFIVNNPYIKRFDHIHYIWKTFPKTRAIGFYSFALNYHINQLHPQGYHIFNFIVHLLAVGMVWATATVLFKIAGWIPFNVRGVTEPSVTIRELPFVMAVLFLVHPCQTQAVTYISQRFESMATVFYLGTIYCYLCARVSSSQANKIFLFTCSIVLAIFGIFTKEVAATIPLMILAVELIVLKGNLINSKKFLSWYYYLLIAVLGIIFVLLFTKIVRTNFVDIYVHFSSPSSSHDGDIITGGRYVLTQMRVFLTFIRLLIFPVHQNLDYDYPLSTGLLNPPLTLLGFCLIGFIAFLIFRLRKDQPLIAFGLAWILITFSINTAPRMNVIFEHKLYLISFGFFLAAVCALSTIIKDRKILFGLLIILIAVLSLVSYKRNQVWENQVTLWEDVTKKSPNKSRPYNGLGVAYDEQGNFIQALSNFNKAIDLNPNYAQAYNGRGNVYSKQGHFVQALFDYDKAIEIDPNYADVYYNRGIFYDKQGDFTQALSNYNKAIEINSDYTEAYYNRGNTYKEQNNFIQALSNYNKAIEENPNYEKAFINRGNIYSREGSFTKAISDYNKAIQIYFEDAVVYVDRGTCYAQQGSFTQALLDYNRAIEINPNYADVYYNRAVSFYQLKEYDRAWKDVYKAEELGIVVSPKFISVLKNASGRDQ